MKLTPEQVTQIAHLARLEITDADKATFGAQLSSILDFVEVMNRVDTTEVEPLEHVVPLVNVWRKDAIVQTAEERAALRDAVVVAFPEKEGDLLKVKGVFSS